MEKTFKCANLDRTGYIFVDELIEVKFTGQEIRRVEDDWQILVNARSGEKTYQVSADNVFDTVDDFTSGQSVRISVYDFSVIGANANAHFFTIENGRVVCHDAEPELITMTFDERGCRFFDGHLSEERIFADEEVAQQMCVTEWKDLEGNLHKKEGILHKLLLTDEQKKAVKAMTDAFLKVRELGVKMAYDNENGGLIVWNGKNVQDSYTVYESDFEEGFVSVEKIWHDDVKEDFQVPEIDFLYYNDGFSVAVKE